MTGGEPRHHRLRDAARPRCPQVPRQSRWDRMIDCLAIAVDGIELGAASECDRRGRPLPVWQGLPRRRW
jgi:hypothetical protein